MWWPAGDIPSASAATVRRASAETERLRRETLFSPAAYARVRGEAELVLQAFDPVQQSNGYGEAQPAAGGAGVREAVLYFAE